MNDTDFLVAMPILSKIPDNWREYGDRFFVVKCDRGLTLVLAPDAEYAERAAINFFGTCASATVERDGDGNPISLMHPVLGGHLVQYLDGVLALEGDPAAGLMRAPDSSPALPMDMAFAIDACGIGERTTTRSRSLNAKAAYYVRRRDDYLRREGLLWSPCPRSRWEQDIRQEWATGAEAEKRSRQGRLAAQSCVHMHQRNAIGGEPAPPPVVATGVGEDDCGPWAPSSWEA